MSRLSNHSRSQVWFTLLESDVPAGSIEVEPVGAGLLFASALTVTPEHFGRGYGHLLLAHVIWYGWQRHFVTLRLACGDNGSGRLRRWYLTQGCQPAGIDNRSFALLETPIHPGRRTLDSPG